MKALQRALTRFWQGFSYGGMPLKAFLSGHVPSGTSFPYITYEVAQGEAFRDTVLTAFVWCKGQEANVQRAEILDLIAQAIPTPGRKLPLDGGFVMLYRNPANFQSFYDDPEDVTVLGGRTSYEVRFYNL